MFALLQAVEGAQVVVLAVKPDLIGKVLMEVKDHIAQDAVIVSIAAGIQIATLEEVLSCVHVIVRLKYNGE